MKACCKASHSGDATASVWSLTTLSDQRVKELQGRKRSFKLFFFFISPFFFFVYLFIYLLENKCLLIRYG